VLENARNAETRKHRPAGQVIINCKFLFFKDLSMSWTQYASRTTQYASRTTQYDTRDTLHASRKRALHLSRELYKSNIFLQNEPKFKIALIYTSACNINSYGNLIAFSRPKNEPKRTQNEPNFSPILGSFFPKLASVSAYRIDSLRRVV